MDIKLLCHKDFTVLNKPDIVIIDLGCAYGDFLSQLIGFNSITAIGVDPLLDYYASTWESRCNNLHRYSRLLQACVVPVSKLVDESSSNSKQVSLNYYYDMPDVSSIYELTSNITDDKEDKASFYHYLPGVVELLKTAEHVEVKVDAISLANLLEDYDHVDILKIDIQGPDLDILLELEPRHLQKITMIHIEGPHPLHQQLLYKRSLQSYDDYLSFFSQRGFDLMGLYKLDNDVDNYTSDLDYIFIRRQASPQQ